ncbi:gamma-glutamyltransferase family protein [Amycolatopsis suaedae]|uniref:Gamma-glutamyltransferase family protein n=1 Tax=Amycolatopsis suaedae TaxID=2510978 RepID=A0A4Q7IYD0_9PSEU|nr:gamma-glutamyltransferase [Amycolatopsis suaedae]RZQ59981.1 gamma-glutamyltransferase family protein [Amycolatopsis suaedae]
MGTPRRITALLGLLTLAASLLVTGNAAAQEKPPSCRQDTGTRVMAATAHPAASLAACRILLAGGSAIDAAVAAQAVLTVVEPQSSGLGGGSLLTYYDARSKKVRFFDGVAAAGHTTTAGLTVPTEREQAAGVPSFGTADVGYSARGVAVPGTLAVLGLVHRHYGRLGWDRLFGDSISLARQGFPVAPYLASMLRTPMTVTPICRFPGLRALFCDGDAPKPEGAIVRNPELAAVLTEVRDGGARAFYDPHGDIAPAIVRALRAGTFDPTADANGPAVIPSLLTERDFADYRAVERQPVCGPVLRHRLCTAAPPATGGVTLTNLLRMAEAKGITGLRPGTAPYAHLAIEASRIAGTDSHAHVGDPGYDPVPAGLTDPAFARERAGLIRPDRAVHPIEPGTPGGKAENTSQISVVDRWGNALSMTTTINLNFGSRVVARGIVLNNGSTNFSAAGAKVNAMEPGKRPRTSIAPSLVFDRRGALRLVTGAAGGGPIPDYVAQTVLGVLVHGEDPATAVGRPHVSGQAETGDCVHSDLEAGTPIAELLPALKERGHPCARATTLRSGLAAVAVTGSGLRGAADPRRDGVALGG